MQKRCYHHCPTYIVRSLAIVFSNTRIRSVDSLLCSDNVFGVRLGLWLFGLAFHIGSPVYCGELRGQMPVVNSSLSTESCAHHLLWVVNSRRKQVSCLLRHRPEKEIGLL